jgi:predicted metalloprotease with PDZ domain
MPVWTPGSYLIREFEKSVESVEANFGSKSALVEHIDKNTWRIATKNKKFLEFSYAVYANEISVRTSFIDDAHAFLHNSSLLMCIDELKDLEGTVVLNFPKKWAKVSTALKPFTQENCFIFESYDGLADSPIEIGNQQEYNFHVMDVKHTLVMVGENNCDMPRFIADLEKVCNTMGQIVGQHPCENYVMIVQNVESGGGGLEHKNSCCVMMNRWNYTNEENYKDFLGLCAHEYFHLWNVKRIRPIELGPFNYNTENYTRQLWVAEGITSYYESLALVRAGFTTRQQFLENLATEITNLENQPGARVQTLAESSFDAWIKAYRPNENSKNTTISYYTKGMIVAALLDAKICACTKGKKNLDAVMKKLYSDFYLQKKRGFSENEFKQTATAIAGCDLSDFIQTHVYSVVEPDYENIFKSAGLKLTKIIENKFDLGLTCATEDGKTIVKYVNSQSASWLGGINVNDVLIALNSVNIKNNVNEVFEGIGHPTKLNFTIVRSGLIREITFDFHPLIAKKYTLQIANLKSEALIKWLGIGE